jgi:hypothetical protein
MVRGFKRLVVAGLATVTLAGPLALISTSTEAAGWHRHSFARYYHHGYYRNYGYWPRRHYYGYGSSPLLGAFAALALAPAALLAPRYYYGPPYNPYWW